MPMRMRVFAAQSLTAGWAILRLLFLHLVTMLYGNQLANLARTFLLALGLAPLRGFDWPRPKPVTGGGDAMNSTNSD